MIMLYDQQEHVKRLYRTGSATSDERKEENARLLACIHPIGRPAVRNATCCTCTSGADNSSRGESGLETEDVSGVSNGYSVHR